MKFFHNLATVLALLVPSTDTCAMIIDFEDVLIDGVPLAEDSYWGGPAEEYTEYTVYYEDFDFTETLWQGTIPSGGADFKNVYSATFQSWSSGFAYSNGTNTADNSLFTNPHSAFPGSGVGQGADNYAVSFGYHDTVEYKEGVEVFDPGSVDHLNGLPTITLPEGGVANSLWVTNTTATALIIGLGDPNGFSKTFGGPTGSDPDWLRLDVYGSNAFGVLPGKVEFYLADFRSGDSNEDYIVDAWHQLDLRTLLGATLLHFNIVSSDIDPNNGMSSPAYFALDNLEVVAGPLPGDFNADGRVDASDYTLWRDALGEQVATPGEGADADLSGTVDQADYEVWRSYYGSTLPENSVNATTPEPASLALLLLAAGAFTTRRHG